MFKVVASGKSLKFFACVLDTTVSHQFCWNTMSAEMFLQCFDGILGSKVIEFSYFNVLGVIINQYQVMTRSCGTWYSLLLCLLFEHSFQANKARPWPSVCTSQFQGVFCVLRQTWLVSWTGYHNLHPSVDYTI